MSLRTEIESFSNLHILVIGDSMIDAYYFGSIERMSPEAPVPVISVSKKDHRPGGAANVALNIKTLGAKATLCSVVGNDWEGEELSNLLLKAGIDTSGIMIDSGRPTTVKTRVIETDRHLLRIDHETTKAISKETEAKIIAFTEAEIETFDAIIFEDYNKGLLTPYLIAQVIAIARQHEKKTIVDPKTENFFAYKHCSLFKPNRKEIKEGLNTDLDLVNISNLEDAVDQLIRKLECEKVMVTLSEDGVFIKSSMESKYIPAHQRAIIDVSGAGDTVVSVAALCMASGMEMKSMAEVANIAGGLVCQKVGVVPITTEELLAEIDRLQIQVKNSGL